MVKEFCEDVHSWLASDPQNIAVVHCMVRAELASSVARMHEYINTRVLTFCMWLFLFCRPERAGRA